MTVPVVSGLSASSSGPAPSFTALRAHPRALAAVPRTYLTAREKETLRLAANGLTNAAIGRHTGVAAETVKTRMQVLRRKLRARDRTHAVAIALALGLLAVDEVDVPVGANAGYRPVA